MVDQAQDTLRPNNRLSDMQATMEQTQAFENPRSFREPVPER